MQLKVWSTWVQNLPSIDVSVGPSKASHTLLQISTSIATLGMASIQKSLAKVSKSQEIFREELQKGQKGNQDFLSITCHVAQTLNILQTKRVKTS